MGKRGVTTKPSIRRNKAKTPKGIGEGHSGREGGSVDAEEEGGDEEVDEDKDGKVSSTTSKRRRR
jgi:hypothetical protein